MLLWPGLSIVAEATDRKHGLKNALRHTIKSVDLEKCEITREGQAIPLMIPTSEVAKLFRLAHALTIDSSQSLTIHGRILIVEADHCYFSLRRLIVALGRSPTGALVQVR